MKVDLTNIFKSKQTKNNHHFVPQVYIKRFYDQQINKVWRLDKKYKTIKSFSSAQIFYEHKLYDIKIYKHVFTDFEDMYSQLEDIIGKIYKKLDKIEKLEIFNHNNAIKKDLFTLIKIIIISQYFRTNDVTPSILEGYCTNLVNTYNSKSESFKKTFDNITMEELKGYERLVIRGIKKEKKYTKELIKALQYSILPILLADFSKIHLKIKKTKQKKFITSDKPVACKKIEDMIQFRNFIYPLSPDILVYSTGEDVTEELIKDDTKVNEYLFNNAISYIVSHDKNIVAQYTK
ncbi:TPA: DUF4238 domain-containing protein [Raoultella ornithinolytica]|uniref:DUF4238 domain-containing protein n=1 Tax=Raoultella ornithinolytica TaxID=54291 RepID=UPI00115B310E|nr:DUF4238 domain-containing protein [Raoultella ornithinolytica]HDH7838212.1 DUF4238 domain-containing protein [Raoultella ornithinolytica]